MEPHGAGLGALFADHAPNAIRLARRITGDRVLAEDLVQEAFVRLAARFPDLRDPGAFGGYLRTTVTNLARSHFRRAKLERTYVEQEARGGQVTGWVPESHLELRDAIMRLPPRQRAAITLRYYEDLPVAQVADVLGCPAGTVKSLASRGIGRLRRELGVGSTYSSEANGHEENAGKVHWPTFRHAV
ncbi:MAG TPA: SigE family RNA polymerase sigma factor [Actinomycetota bacterium]|jgi:RNA polymerase sigma-70 factor (sigma-E family)|nr:SigE family RNA polymerase sigma factor [Actinomycetota bacterium]